MDVKDIQTKTAAKGNSGASNQSSLVQKSLKSLSAQSIDTSRAEPVRVEVEERGKTSENNETRRKTNSLISVVNYASEATDEIEKLVRSVDGILEQAGSGSVDGQRAQVLEQEANDLIEEVRKKANSAAPDGSKPLAGEKVELKDVDKVLEVILPDDAKDAFGLGPITLSTKDAILQTRESVRQALGRIENLQRVVDRTKSEVGSAVAEIEVALANQEASESSVRDVDKALEVGNRVGSLIRSEPDKAFGSFSRLEPGNAEELLK